MNNNINVDILTEMNIKKEAIEEVEDFKVLLEDGEIYISPETLSLAYIIQNEDGRWEVYTNSGHMYRAYDSKAQAQKKAYAMHMWGKKQLEQGIIGNYDAGPPEEGKITPRKHEKVEKKNWGSWQDKPREKKFAMDKMDNMATGGRKKKSQSGDNSFILPEKEQEVENGNNDNNEDEKMLNNSNMPIPELSVDDEHPPEEIETIPLLQNGKILKEFILFRDGEWDFAQDIGIVFKVDKEFRNAVLKNFNDGVRGQLIPVVDGHDGSKKAYGWISKMWEQDNQLMITIRWNKRGREALKDEQFAYHSPQVKFNYYDPETKKYYGATLIELTLTNTPRIKRSSAVLAGFSEVGNINNDGCYIRLEELSGSDKHNIIINSLSYINQNRDLSALKQLIEVSRKANIELSYDMTSLFTWEDEIQNKILKIRDISEFIPDTMETKYLENLHLSIVIGKLNISPIGERACQAIKFDKQFFNEEDIIIYINEYDLFTRAFNDKDKFITEMETLNIEMSNKNLNINNNNLEKEDDSDAKEKGREEERRVQVVIENPENSTVEVELKVTPEPQVIEQKDIKEVEADKTESLAQNLFNKFMNYFNINSRKEEVLVAVPNTPVIAMSEETKEIVKEEVKEIKEIKASEVAEVKLESVPVSTVTDKLKEVVEDTNIKLTEDTNSLILSELISLKKKNEALELKLAENEAKLAEKEMNELNMKDSIFLEELIDGGKMLPVDKSLHADFIQDLRRADKIMKKNGIQLAENTGAYISLEEKYKNVILKGASKVVSYGEIGSPNNPKPKREIELTDRAKLEEKIANEAMELSKTTGKPYLDAVVELAEKYKFDFDLKEAN